MGYYLGFVGSSRISKLALASEEGKIVAYNIALPLTVCVNPNIRQNLQQSFENLAQSAGIGYNSMIGNLKGSCIAMSGVYNNRQQNTLRQILSNLNFNIDGRCVICEDVNAHLSSNFYQYGGVIIGSTGSNVFFKGEKRADNTSGTVRVDGWGSDIGDDGGGYDLGRKCLRALFKGIDRRKKRDEELERAVLNFVGLCEVEDLVQWYNDVRNTPYWRSKIADLSIPLIDAAENHDNWLAKKLVEKGAGDLYDSFLTACERIEDPLTGIYLPRPCKLILEGGLFEHSRIYRKTFLEGICIKNLNGSVFDIVDPEYNPVVGALALAISGSGYISGENPLFSNLRQSACENGLNIIPASSMEDRYANS